MRLDGLDLCLKASYLKKHAFLHNIGMTKHDNHQNQMHIYKFTYIYADIDT